MTFPTLYVRHPVWVSIVFGGLWCERRSVGGTLEACTIPRSVVCCFWRNPQTPAAVTRYNFVRPDVDPFSGSDAGNLFLSFDLVCFRSAWWIFAG